MVQHRGGGLLLAIALFKLVKASVLVALGVGALSLVHDPDVHATLRHWANEFRIDPHNRLFNRALSAISGFRPRRLEELGIGTFVYAAVFVVEGVGLLRHQRWAEWLTLFVTASFIPFEIYEMVQHPSVLKGSGIALNVSIVAYLAALRFRARAHASAEATTRRANNPSA